MTVVPSPTPTPAPEPTPPAPPAPAPTPPAPAPPATPPGDPAGSKEAVLADLARERDKRQAAEAELDTLRTAQLTDTDKAIKAAKEEGRREASTLVAAAEIKAALTGVVPDPASIVEDLNLAKYVTDKGAVDVAAIAALKTKYQGLNAGSTDPDLGQGRRQQAKPQPGAGGRAEAIRRGFIKEDAPSK